MYDTPFFSKYFVFCVCALRCAMRCQCVRQGLIYFGDSYYYILASRVCTGLTAGGVQSTIILYISEISSNHIRGRLASFSQLSRNFGVLISYTVGAVLPYHMQPCIFIFVPIIFGIWFFFLPNTPQYHLKKGQIEVA